MRLTQFFTGVAAKQLRAVEADTNTSNQHEFNGINLFRQILGDRDRSFETVFLYLDDEGEPLSSHGHTTWYDSRRNQPRRSAEYRLYFPSTEVSSLYTPGDLLIVAQRPDDTLLIIAAPAGSSVGDQLLWLFGLESPNGSSEVRHAAEIDREVDYVVRWVLESIGIEPPTPETDTNLLLEQFGRSMPNTRVFSDFAREQAVACNPLDDPDHALITWLESEERYFRAFERLLLEERLRNGFITDEDQVDVDGFIAFSLSVQNRRKSRAGYALENHLEHVFEAWQLRFDRGATTEGKAKPDFLFPSRAAYLDASFAANRLAILGAKASCKDRWRQVLGEADRIHVKHLVTLEPSISVTQTEEMKSRNVQLVLPAGIHSSYSKNQQSWLWTVKGFIAHIRDLQQP
ncbi:type II restriction endonuclease [Mucisphaera sp.]|uniref:type II restriction endonuclease n=1 Tax=Mucisphaera sp. TaxID=2913024 RepID=UPI003D135373